MRGLLLMAAAAFVLTLGLGCRSNHYEQAYYQGAPRVNLYPLTSPPAGSVQPVRGYGPTQVSATQDYYGQSNYAGYNTGAGYYGNTYQTAGYNPGYTTGGYTGGYMDGYNTGAYSGGYNPGSGYVGYQTSQDPFPAGTVGAGMGAGTVTNPFNPAGGYCRVEEVTPYMNPTVPIKDPPVVIGNNINLGQTGATGGYTAGYTTGYTTGYTQPAAYTAGYTTGAASTAGYATGSYGYTAPAGLSATVSTVGSNINYDSGPVPYCGPGVACPPDPRVDTSMYGGVSTVTAPQAQTTYGGESGGTADLVTGGYGASSYGSSASYGSSSLVGGGYSGGTDFGYAGGAYPRAIDTIPATYRTNSFNPALSPVSSGVEMGGGLRLVPVRDIPPGMHPSDAGPSQWFEIIRPGNGAIRIGRVSATCVCVGVRVPKRQVGAGERALIEVRTLSRPPANNLTYGVYVNIVEPQQTVLDADVTISL